jgi:hypothetical protein
VMYTCNKRAHQPELFRKESRERERGSKARKGRADLVSNSRIASQGTKEINGILLYGTAVFQYFGWRGRHLIFFIFLEGACKASCHLVRCNYITLSLLETEESRALRTIFYFKMCFNFRINIEIGVKYEIKNKLHQN